MKKKIMALGLVTLLGSLSLISCGGNNNVDICKESTEDDLVHIYILAGQSGARGKALNTDLSAEDKAINYDVDIIADGLQMPALNNIPQTPNVNSTLSELKPGYGDSGNEFGPEIGMGQTLRSRFLKDGLNRKSVIIKYTASGSTFTSDWYSSSLLNESSTITDKINKKQIRTNPVTSLETGPLTNNLYQLIDMAKTQIEEEGLNYVFDGVTFLHGEQDAKFDDNMDIYQVALTDWVKDLRSYVNDEKLPVVIPEALTNSAKYSNKLRQIQKDVCSNDENMAFLSTADLKTNTFEPWHFGSDSNLVLGNRIASELINLKDLRVIKSFNENSINVPYGVEISLPEYQIATFDNETAGYVKIDNYEKYDVNKVGEQIVKYSKTINCKKYEGSLTVNVKKEPYIDGGVSDPSYVKKNVFKNNLGSFYCVKGDEGITVGFDINDTEIYSDGEAWSIGDMGQRKENDDFRIYLTSQDASQRYTIALSSASLLRVYNQGISINKDSDTKLSNGNLYFKKAVPNFNFKTITKGIVNGGESNGLTGEVFIPFADLDFTKDEDFKLLFEYSNIGKVNDKKVETKNYFFNSSSTVSENYEEDTNSYISINDLI